VFDTAELPMVGDVLAGRVPPGPDAIRALAEADPVLLSTKDRAEVVTAWEAQRGWFEAQSLTAVHALASPDPDADRR
jgi:hypothetical protein